MPIAVELYAVAAPKCHATLRRSGHTRRHARPGSVPGAEHQASAAEQLDRAGAEGRLGRVYAYERSFVNFIGSGRRVRIRQDELPSPPFEDAAASFQRGDHLQVGELAVDVAQRFEFADVRSVTGR